MYYHFSNTFSYLLEWVWRVADEDCSLEMIRHLFVVLRTSLPHLSIGATLQTNLLIPSNSSVDPKSQTMGNGDRRVAQTRDHVIR
jgi:hypothetical protein